MIILRQLKPRFIAKLLLFILLGTQTCLAFNAGFLFALPAKTKVGLDVTATPSCHSQRNANADTSRSLCRLHCAIDAQSIDQHETLTLPPCLEGAPILALRAMPPARYNPRGTWRDARSTDPPIAIRFCSFLI